MQLLYSTSSPFVRKTVLLAHALGLDHCIEWLPSAASPLKRDPRITARNPLGKVPTLITDDGLALVDSKVIAEYLCALAPDDAVLPAQGAGRWRLLRQQALADGILDVAVGLRYENALRPEGLRWPDWTAAQMEKLEAALEALQDEFAAPVPGAPLNVGEIATIAALGYLDLRYADFGWRTRYPRLAAAYASVWDRPEVRATTPVVA
ncbi:glutathione S-transferase family protein [Parapusillimonas granuli]|uniref:Glutathione S-transferase family protein n=1 Tax=Parapusillimonas granuli TaxID=380911 RepID=A0A853G9W2_9BURK|nr:glutathione S-transferase family protein [Parapusillimonas granuli]MBB5214287.1 glutathione S-transferase [Parapusillimonas granuli]NYT51391.1 glutathione S-transferase family protein [Parapusillimonas granuli]